MGLSTDWFKAHYCCWECNKSFTRDELKINGKVVWKCPDCNENIFVYVEDKDWNYVFIRKYADEIEKGDLVYLSQTGQSHEVLNEPEEINGKIKVALKGHTVVKIPEDNWVDCSFGTWDSNTTPWEK